MRNRQSLQGAYRLRVDISSADFPRFDHDTNRGGERGDPIPAKQIIYHDSERPSHLLVSVLNTETIPDRDSIPK